MPPCSGVRPKAVTPALYSICNTSVLRSVLYKRIRFHYANLDRHFVENFEAEEALRDGWNRRRRDGDHFEVLGRTEEGRYLQLVVTERPEEVYVFHGREMTDAERRRYKRK